MAQKEKLSADLLQKPLAQKEKAAISLGVLPPNF